MISSDADFKKPELTYNNLTTTKFQLPMEKLETGKMYYVGVSLVDNGKYVSSPAGPIILETPVPAKDMIGEKQFNLGSFKNYVDSKGGGGAHEMSTLQNKYHKFY